MRSSSVVGDPKGTNNTNNGFKKNIKSLGLLLVNILVGQIDGSIAMQDHSGITYTIRFAKSEFNRRT